MTVTINGATVRKYTDILEVIQLLATIPAGTTVTVTYTPTADYVFLFSSIISGPQVISPLFTALVTLDGTFFFNVYSGGHHSADGKLMDSFPGTYAKHDITVVLTNSDTVSHTVDFTMHGFQIRRDLLEQVEKELRNDDIREQNTKMIDLLTEIGEKIGIPAPPPELPPPPPEEELPPPLPPEPPVESQWWHLADALSRQDELLEQILRAIQGVPPPEESPPETQTPTTENPKDNYDKLIEKLNNWYNSRRIR